MANEAADTEPEVSQTQYSNWTGKSRKTINSHADRYGVPCRKSPIRIDKVLKWLHEYLADRGRRHLDEDDPINDDPVWRDKCYEARWELMQLDLANKRGEMAPREYFHAILERWMTILRSLGEQLGRLHGPEAVRLLNDALDDCDAIIDQVIAEVAGESAE